MRRKGAMSTVVAAVILLTAAVLLLTSFTDVMSSSSDEIGDSSDLSESVGSVDEDTNEVGGANEDGEDDSTDEEGGTEGSDGGGVEDGSGEDDSTDEEGGTEGSDEEVEKCPISAEIEPGYYYDYSVDNLKFYKGDKYRFRAILSGVDKAEGVSRLADGIEGVSYSWSGAVTGTSKEVKMDEEFSETGDRKVELDVEYNDCKASDSISFEVKEGGEKPQVSVFQENKEGSILVGEEERFVATVVTADSIYDPSAEYEWYFDDGLVCSEECGDSESIMIESTGSHEVKVQATDSRGVEGEGSMTFKAYRSLDPIEIDVSHTINKDCISDDEISIEMEFKNNGEEERELGASLFPDDSELAVWNQEFVVGAGDTIEKTYDTGMDTSISLTSFDQGYSVSLRPSGGYRYAPAKTVKVPDEEVKDNEFLCFP